MRKLKGALKSKRENLKFQLSPERSFFLISDKTDICYRTKLTAKLQDKNVYCSIYRSRVLYSNGRNKCF